VDWSTAMGCRAQAGAERAEAQGWSTRRSPGYPPRRKPALSPIPEAARNGLPLISFRLSRKVRCSWPYSLVAVSRQWPP
jgi:hypothetical protein